MRKLLFAVGALALMVTYAWAQSLPTPNVAGLKVNGTTENFPASGNIVGTTDTQTLTNKSMSGSANTFTSIPISTAISGLGTGVGTALGVNVGTAGSVVVNGGALGTPSSGTATNITGLPYAGLSSGAIATAGNYQANAASTLLGPNAVWSAASPTALTDAATIAVDLSTGINFGVTIAGNRTLGNPTNAKVGQSGVFHVTQGSGGSHTLAYASDYKFSGGTACTLSTTAAQIDYIFYFVYSSTEILLNCVLNVS